MTERPFVVVNPMAANGRVGREWSGIKRRIERAVGPVEWAHTERGGHATELAREALGAGHPTVVSVGGDGTHSQVVNGFFEGGRPLRPGAALAVLPFGTGGDFRRMLPVGRRDFDGFLRLLGEEARPMDVGHLAYTREDGGGAEQVFLNIASFGMSALVDQVVNRQSKALGGKLSFLAATLQVLKGYRPTRVRIRADGHGLDTLELFVAAVCNGRYFGGGMRIGPYAELADARLDLVVVPWRGRLWHLARGLDVYAGRHIAWPGLKLLRVREIRAESEGDCWLDVDGEVPGKLPATVRVLPGALRLHGLPEAG